MNHFYVEFVDSLHTKHGFVEGQATEKLNLKTAGALPKKKIRPQKNGRTTGCFFSLVNNEKWRLGGYQKMPRESFGTMHEGI